jgi:hypothetical protein
MWLHHQPFADALSCLLTYIHTYIYIHTKIYLCTLASTTQSWLPWGTWFWKEYTDKHY